MTGIILQHHCFFLARIGQSKTASLVKRAEHWWLFPVKTAYGKPLWGLESLGSGGVSHLGSGGFSHLGSGGFSHLIRFHVSVFRREMSAPRESPAGSWEKNLKAQVQTLLQGGVARPPGPAGPPGPPATSGIDGELKMGCPSMEIPHCWSTLEVTGHLERTKIWSFLQSISSKCLGFCGFCESERKSEVFFSYIIAEIQGVGSMGEGPCRWLWRCFLGSMKTHLQGRPRIEGPFTPTA